MLENWVWDKKMIKRLSKHVKTGEPMPDELFDKMIAVNMEKESSATLSQLFLASFDLIVHTATDKTKELHPDSFIAKARQSLVMKEDGLVDTGALWGSLKETMSGIKQTPGTNPAASFGHIYGGYESQYYGYLWSLVYSCDLFTEFQEKGIMNKEVGDKYRRLIL